MTHRYDRRSFLQVSGGALAASLAPVAIGAERNESGRGQGLVVGQPEAAEAGVRCLAEGGNAVDAIATAALVAGVVAGWRGGVGGGGGGGGGVGGRRRKKNSRHSILMTTKD